MGKVNCMRFNTDDGYEKTVPKKEKFLNLDSLSTISITAEEAKALGKGGKGKNNSAANTMNRTEFVGDFFI